MRNLGERALAVGLVAAFWAMLSLATSSACVVKALIGVPCPGCGMTRAWLAAFHGEFGEAFRCHPLFPLAAIIGVCLIGKDVPVIKRVSSCQWFWGLALTLLLAVYAFRMLRYFPRTPPMEYHAQSVLARIARMMLH